MEQRVMAFAEQLGRMVGTIQAKADGWLDGEALPRQIATIRDEAAHLLDQLTGGAKKATKRATAAAAAARQAGKGRSGGVVDAPGKKHRKTAPADPQAKTARSQADKVRMAKTMVKTHRRRGRG
jgi:thioesterase domain-containing protein